MTKKSIFTIVFCLTCLLLAPLPTMAQEVEKQTKKEKKEEKEKNYQITGYIKDLRTFFLFDKFDNLTQENRIHNRLNFKWFPSDKWTIKAELRNQLIYGEFPKTYNNFIAENEALINLLTGLDSTVNIPLTYGELLAPPQALLNLSWTPIDERAVILNGYLDRLSVDYYGENFQVTIGRQRINWGLNWVWNPNDLFNTYSFVDFDYEERPGSDAIRLQFFSPKGMTFEFVRGFQKEFKESIFATRIGWNKWNYDFQGIASWYKTELAFGLGWAGNIGNAGFKGEFTYFSALGQTVAENNGLVGSIGFDYSFLNGILLQTEFLFNSFGATEPEYGLLSSGFGGQSLSPKNLWPHRYGIFFGSSYAITPLLQGSLAFIFNPTDKSYFLSPSLTWSLKQNLDLLFVMQYTGKQEFPFPLNTAFGDFYGNGNIRLKWSF